MKKQKPKQKSLFEIPIPKLNIKNPLQIINKPKKNVKKKNLTWLQSLSLYGKKINPYKDSDKDGVMNMMDCRPFDKKRQDFVTFKGKQYDIQTPQHVKEMTNILNKRGGRSYIVGGWVRDTLMDKKPKDVDIEVHGLPIDDIKNVLAQSGYHIDEVGKSFGVLKVNKPMVTQGFVDVAVPREDRSGRKPEVNFIKNATPESAAKRRDFTINSIMYDTKNDKVIDPFNGIRDLESGTIRQVSKESFTDDPLRTVRAAQFAARFDFTIDPETRENAKTVNSSSMAPERTTDELRKVFDKGKRPSKFFKELDEMGQLEKLFPDVKRMQTVKQDPIHHPEGDAYTHSMDVMDRVSDSDKRKLTLLVSALLHDIGKISTSKEDPETKRIQALGHEIESEKMAKKILLQYKFTNDEIHDILTIIKNHMKPHHMIFTNATKLKHKHRLLRDVCATRNIMKNPKDSISKYCDLIEFAKHDQGKNTEKYDELKQLLPEKEYIPKTTGQDLYDRGYRGKELGKKLEELYINQINHPE
jgi:tRNA nucleotidyltransferase (CCA-adding enzyme)